MNIKNDKFFTISDALCSTVDFVKYKNRKPDPGKCKIISINFETCTLEVSNGSVRLWPSFDEVVKLELGE